MAIPSSILPWRIPWTEETGGLQSMGILIVTNQSNIQGNVSFRAH